MANDFSLKELYDVSLKATYPMEVNGKSYEIGEVVTTFDRLQIANFNEIKSRVAATGGFDNRAHVIWEDTKQIEYTFSQGIFSELQFAMLSNSRLIQKEPDTIIPIAKREQVEIDENGEIELEETPVGKIFVYEKETGDRIKDFGVEGNTLTFEDLSYVDVIVDYTYNYVNGGINMILGRRLITGFLFLEGKTKVKEDITGIERTGIIKIPKLKLMSDLSIRLGNNANPVIANFRASGFPIGDKGNKKVMEIIFLNDDIDSDI